MLEYDNSAFYYFGISIGSLYVLPATYYSLKRILFGCVLTTYNLPKEHEIRCEKEMQKLKKLHQEKTKLANVFSWPFVLQLIFLISMYYFMYEMVMLVKDDSQIKTFDPFAILELANGASDRDIKKAYRKMSLLYHPDKNIGDAIAESKFLMVAKAYEALTDEVAKANYEKYGNPDGRQALQVSIGLPTFLMSKENHNLVLVIYLIGLVIVIPSLVALWYTNSKKYGDGMILYDSYGFYNYTLSEHAHLKMMPEVLAGSAEFREIPLRESNNETLGSLLRLFKQDALIQKPRHNHPMIVKANLLIHSHLLRKELPHDLQSDLNFILKKSKSLIDGILEICASKGWLQTTINVIDFSQHLVQALPFKSSSLLQLPNFTEAEVKHCMTGKSPVRTLEQFIRSEPENRKGMNKFTPEELAEVERVCGILPNIEVDVKVSVDDEAEIAEGDIITITVTMTRKNVAEGEPCDLVYAPSFPYPRAERWILLLGEVKQNRMMAMKKVTSQEKVVVETIMLQAPPSPGEYSLDLFVKSDSYLGLDQQHAVKFTVISANDLPVYQPHPEDVALDNEPTLFEQVMLGGGDDDSSDSEGENEKEEKVEKENKVLSEASDATEKENGGDTETARRRKQGDKTDGGDIEEIESDDDNDKKNK